MLYNEAKGGSYVIVPVIAVSRRGCTRMGHGSVRNSADGAARHCEVQSRAREPHQGILRPLIG
jgi:hypothetical protein